MTDGFLSRDTTAARAGGPPAGCGIHPSHRFRRRRPHHVTAAADRQRGMGARARLTGTLQTIDYSVTAAVATVCLNRPEARNAIDMRMADEFLDVARRIAADDSIRAVLICGNGPR